MKSCSKCGEVKPLDMFYKNSGCVGGYRHDCKSCANKERLLEVEILTQQGSMVGSMLKSGFQETQRKQKCMAMQN